MEPDHERDALTEAEAYITSLDATEARLARASAPLVATESELVHEALMLVRAAVEIGVRRPTSDPRMKAFGAIAATLEHLIRHGWRGLITGHYAAAVQPARLIDEMSDLVVAVAVDEPAARAVLAAGSEKRRMEVGKACAIVRKWIESRSATVANDWNKHQLEMRQHFHLLAHATSTLLGTAAHVEQDGYGFGLLLNERRLRLSAALYVVLAHAAVIGIATALHMHLPDGGAWSERQATYLERCEMFMRSSSVRQLLPDLTV